MKNPSKTVTSEKALSELQQEIQQLDMERTARMEAFEAKRNERLDQLHTELGYSTRDELVESLINMGATPRNNKIHQKAAGKAGKAAGAPSGGGRKSGITQEIKDAVVRDVKSGEFTSANIARRHGISVPSVQNIKRDNNLVRGSRAA